MRKYRVGDYILYEYSGSFSEKKVFLQECIVNVSDLYLIIEVSLRRGADHKLWRQVVIDTPENRDRNHIEALLINEGRGFEPVENEIKARLCELYSWTCVENFCAPSSSDMASFRRVNISGKYYDCQVSTGNYVLKSDPVKYEFVDCPSFLWTHISGWIKDAYTDEVIWRIEIVEHGVKSPAEMSGPDSASR